MAGWFRKKQRQSGPACAAVVAAAGSSTRMGEDKLMLPLGEEPVILHTLRALELCPYVEEIVVVTREQLIVPLGELCRDYQLGKVRKIVLGGDTRTQSVRLGTLEVSEQAELIAIQDGARPLVSQQVLEQVILTPPGAAPLPPAVPVKDTIKRAENGVVLETPERSQLFAVQTPQVFEAGSSVRALHKALEDGAEITDDCSAVERLGMKVVLTQGADENIKITTPADLAAAKAFLSRREAW